ncbi:MAG TPA: hypothetical protein VL043_06615 [Protaetiibacter sp.]|nr:hypothetical protein [Protaetiibacter sp.]
MATRIRRARRPGIAELIDDALLVARAGVRQSLKNVVIVRTLRDGAAYDADWYGDAVRAELELLAVESEEHAARLTREIDYAKGRHLRAVTAADYMARDVPKLKRRRKVQLALAARLRELADDPDAVRALVEQARLDALDDIAAAAAEVPQRRHPRALTGSARRIALADLLDDLAALAHERPDS